MFCEKCGKQIPDDSVFCEFCGGEVTPLTGAQIKTGQEWKETETVIQVPDDSAFCEYGGEETDLEETRPLPQVSNHSSDQGKWIKRYNAGVQENVAAERAQSENTQAEPQESLEPVSELCPQCGALLRGDAKFCDKCGARLITEEPQSKAQSVICQNCGRELAADARFCDGCGAPQGVGVYIPPKPAEPSLFAILLRKFFKEPVGAICLAAEKEGIVPGVVFFLIKDAILAILAAMLLSKLVYELGIFGMLFSDGDTFVAAVKVFFITAFLDALWAALLFGGGKVFGGDCTLAALIGGCGTSSILLSLGWILTAIVIAISAPLGICPLLALVGIMAASTYLVLTEVMQVSKDKSFYAASLAMLAYFLVIYIGAYLVMNSGMGNDYI